MDTRKPPRMLGRAVALAMLRAGADQVQVATAAGMSASAVSRMCAGLRRPDPESLARLIAAACWSSSDRARIMIGHLRDEMSRAGWARLRDIAIYPRPAAINRQSAARAALVLLAEHSHIEEIGELLIDLADLVQRGIVADELEAETTEPEPLREVAESSADYQIRKTTPRNVSKMRRAKSENSAKNPKI